MFEEDFPGFTVFDCSLFPPDLPFRGKFAAPYFLDPFSTSLHSGSILINEKNDIFIRNVVRPVSSAEVIFCVKHSSDLPVLSARAARRLRASLKRLTSFFTDIDIHDYPLLEIPDYVRAYTLLHTLKLDNVSLTDIPDFLGDLPSLRILILSRNPIKSLPPSLLNLKHLKQLTLDNNPHLLSLNGIDGHPSLMILIARNCSIERLPRHLPKLTALYLSDNQLSDLDGIDTLGFDSLKEKSFSFDGNQILSVPQEIHSVRNLALLNLNGNQLSQLPGELKQMPALFRLSIERNCFRPHTLQLMVEAFNQTHPRLNFKYKEQRSLEEGVCSK